MSPESVKTAPGDLLGRVLRPSNSELKSNEHKWVRCKGVWCTVASVVLVVLVMVLVVLGVVFLILIAVMACHYFCYC